MKLTRDGWIGVGILILTPVLFSILAYLKVLTNVASALEQIAILVLGSMIIAGVALIYHGRKSTTIVQKEDLQSIGEAEAERKHELDVKEGRIKAHREDLVKVYRKWAKCYATHPSRYNYGYTSFRIQIAGLPDGEDYYKEARTDLECYPKTHGLLLNAEKLAKEANTRGDLLVTEMEHGVKQALEKHGLTEWDEGGHATGKWYRLKNIIPLLIVKPVAEGDQYRKLKVEIQGSLIRATEEGSDLSSKFETKEGSPVDVLGGLTLKLVPQFSKKIVALQDDLKNAELAYSAFRNSLLEEVVKPLETGLPLLGGGKCGICLSLRA